MVDLITQPIDTRLRSALSELASYSQISNTTAGSKARSLLEIIFSETDRLERALSANTILGLLGGASGTYLDFIGEIVGVQRTPQKTASAIAESQIIKLTPPGERTFGDLNAGRSITIPAATTILSPTGSIRYSTIGRIVLNPDETEAYISARSQSTGNDGNIPINTLTRIDFTNYSSYPQLELTVSNESAISNGAAPDTDDFFRYRIQNALLSAERANATAVRLAALSVPSVSNIVILDLYRGVGTADLIVDTKFGDLASETLLQVQDRVNRVSALGADIQIRPPELIGLEVEARVRYRAGTSIATKDVADRAIRLAVANVIAQTSLGGTLLLNDLAQAIKSAHSSIADIGQPNKPLDSISLWEPGVLSERSLIQTSALVDISLNADQRLIAENGIDRAVRIKR